jgi:hypothetical protein
LIINEQIDAGSRGGAQAAVVARQLKQERLGELRLKTHLYGS